MHLRDTGALYDERHFEALSRISWSLGHGYARHIAYDPATGKRHHRFQMHRLIWELEYGLPVPGSIDHINGNRLDNRVCNLRAATFTLQALNNKGRAIKRSGLPVGVFCNSRSKKRPYWSSTSYKGSVYHLGCFETPEEASAAYFRNREALIEYEAALARGESPEKPMILKTAVLTGNKVGDHKRKDIAKLATEGKTVTDIAKELCLSAPTVRKWIRHAGAPLHHGKTGRPAGPKLALKRLLEGGNNDSIR
jgi:HNH endonuclease/Homeodomain-like domain